MEHEHTHCTHHHHSHFNTVDARMSWAVVLNVGLTCVQIIGGVMSGSLALIAEAVHNFSDAATLILALAAQKIARRKPDLRRTYGYRKVETLSAYTNFMSLILLSLWLAFEAIARLINPHPVGGLTVMWVSVIAVVSNMGTVLLMVRDAKNSQNIRAALIHNLADSLSSIGVIIAGFLIIKTGYYWIDPVITLMISAYIIWHAFHDLPSVVNILIDGAPEQINIDHVTAAITAIEGVESVHHVHIRYLNEHQYALEAHIVQKNDVLGEDATRERIKNRLKDFKIAHSTLEFEQTACAHTECM